MKTQEEYAREIDEIVRRDVESCQIDWFKIDKEIFMLPENKNKTFILGTRKTGCDLLILGGTNCDESYLDRVLGGGVSKDIHRKMKKDARKYANDFRVWIDYAGDYRFSK